MGMVDTGSYPSSSRTIYDRVEYALSWMDRVITGQEFRNVLSKSSSIVDWDLNEQNFIGFETMSGLKVG